MTQKNIECINTCTAQTISKHFNFGTKENKNAIHKLLQFGKGNFITFIHEATHDMSLYG